MSSDSIPSPRRKSPSEKRLSPAMNGLPSPRRESPGERASAAGPAGRSKAGSLRRSNQQNSVAVKKNSRYPPPGGNPPSLPPPKARLPAPPPPTDPPPKAPPPRAPHEKDEDFKRRLQAASRKPIVAAASPTRASTPPKRPPRPSSELMLDRSQSQSPSFRRLKPSIERATTTSCASPRGESPLRQMTNMQESRIKPSDPRPLSGVFHEPFIPMAKPSRASVLSLQRPPLSEASINAAAARMIRDRRGSGSTTSSLAMSSISLPYPTFTTERVVPDPPRATSLISLRRARSTFSGGDSRRENTRRHARKKSSGLDSQSRSGVRSLLSRRIDAASFSRSVPVRPEILNIDNLKRAPKQQSGLAKSMKPTSPTAVKTLGRRKRKGETMSMLLDDGFFPVEELVYGSKPPMAKAKNRYTSMAGFKINLPPRLSFIESTSPLSPITPPWAAKPTTPDGGSETPTTPRSARNRRHAGQSLLPQISESEDGGGEQGATGVDIDQTSPSKSKANPGGTTSRDERSPSPGTVAPVATQIQLRNGSIVTLTPPELTAWQPTIYLHGPIKLPKPTIMPRKNSVATLDPFQDAIERLYQSTLTIPRRRSDDAVVDDICEYFDAFGFDLISFAGDDFSYTDFGVGEVRDIHLDAEKFTTPPTEPALVPPAEAKISNETLERRLSSLSSSLQAPPVENEETLRARGIARLSRNSAGTTPDEGKAGRKESITLSKPQTSAVLPLLPAPETSMLDAVLQPAQRDGSYNASGSSQRRPEATNALLNRNVSLHMTRSSSSGVQGGRDDGVEEMMSAATTWSGNARPVVAVAVAASKEPKLSRMRRLVATASSIL